MVARTLMRLDGSCSSGPQPSARGVLETRDGGGVRPGQPGQKVGGDLPVQDDGSGPQAQAVLAQRRAASALEDEDEGIAPIQALLEHLLASSHPELSFNCRTEAERRPAGQDEAVHTTAVLTR